MHPVTHARHALPKLAKYESPVSDRPAVVLAKMAIDQLIFTPVGTVIFYSAFKTMEGNAAGIPATLSDKFWPTLLAGYALWPVAHIINFRCCNIGRSRTLPLRSRPQVCCRS